MCRVLGVSTSGYYAGRQRTPSRRAQEREALSRRIAAIHVESRQSYGARRVQAELKAEGVSVSRPRVARLMRALGLQGVTRRKRRCTTRREREAAVAPDRVQRRFEASEPNRLWVADITYVPTLEGFVYLATVLDVFSRKVVGWALGARQTVELVQAGLEMALQMRAAQGVVLHSDRGSQYTALAFSRRCAEAGIERSMGAAGNCYDNAMAEIARVGRARWKIENEGFNCLARHGYNIKRNFGHGSQGLANLLATLNLFAFALHEIQDCACALWRRCRQRAGPRREFFEQLRFLTQWFCFRCWTALFETLLEEDPPTANPRAAAPAPS